MKAPEDAFRLEMTAPGSDVDELGHISNVAYVRWIQDVAIAASAARGYDLSAYQALGAVFVVRRHEIEYLSPAFGGDRLLLFTWVESYRGVSTIRRTEIVRADDEKPLVSAVTRWILVGTTDGKPKRIPREMAVRFGVATAEKSDPTTLPRTAYPRARESSSWNPGREAGARRGVSSASPRPSVSPMAARTAAETTSKAAADTKSTAKKSPSAVMGL